MPADLALSLMVLAGAIVLIATGALRTDLVALAVIVSVSLLGLLSPGEAIAGFANPAVVTIAGMFVISAGLARTGVAELLGRWLISVAGERELRLTVAITLVSGLLSGLVNNIAVAAMMLPVVVTVARRTSVPPSKLLIPMALGTQLGGFTTLLGTATNLLASDALREAGLEPFGLFAYAPIGLALLGTGTVMVTVLAPRLLPDRGPGPRPRGVRRPGIRGDVDLDDQLFILDVPPRSLLSGKTLAATRLGSAVGVHVLAIQRGDEVFRAPGPEVVLLEGDRIIVQGRPDYFEELRGHRHLRSDGGRAGARLSGSPRDVLASARLTEDSDWIGSSPADLDLRAQTGVLVLAVRGPDGSIRIRAGGVPLGATDELLLQGTPEALSRLEETRHLKRMERLDADAAIERFALARRLWALRVTRRSLLAGRPLSRTRLGDAAGLMVLSVERKTEDGETESTLFPGPDFVLEGGDHLLVKARGRDLAALRGLQRLTVDLDTPVDPEILEGSDAGFTEAVVAPHSGLVGKTLRQTHFRERYGLHVVAIVREGGSVPGDLGNAEIRFGDALLLYGSRRHQRALAEQPDLIPLHSARVEGPEFRLAPRSLIVAVLAVSTVVLGWVAVPVAVIGGSVMMVLTRCLTLDEAYRAVSLPALTIIAGMLALGAALDQAGAMELLGSFLLSAFEGRGPMVLLAALMVVAALGGQILPGAALVVVMAPIAITIAQTLGVSAQPFVMAVGIAATSVASPVSQPANALMMSPAGYRTSDFFRLGIPITVMVLIVTLLLVPVFLPF